MTAVPASEHMQTVTIPVRIGRFGYVRVASDGTTVDLHINVEARERGQFETIVAQGDCVLEIAFGSTSDPDLDRARGQIWPVVEGER